MANLSLRNFLREGKEYVIKVECNMCNINVQEAYDDEFRVYIEKGECCSPNPIEYSIDKDNEGLISIIINSEDNDDRFNYSEIGTVLNILIPKSVSFSDFTIKCPHQVKIKLESHLDKDKVNISTL